VNSRNTIIAIIAALSPSLAFAEDFKTINGKEYKNVIVSRVEADGLVLRTKAGISKVYFIELPKDVQERFHYSPANAVAAQREREPIKVEAKQDDSRQADQPGWTGVLPVSALFLRLLGVGALVITGVVTIILRSRF
jgi:hypothetical protein